MTNLNELEALAKADDYSTMSKTVTVSKQDILQMIALIRQMEGALEYYDFANGVPHRALNALMKEFGK